MLTTEEKTNLRKALIFYFNEEELITLCTDSAIDFENLSGDTKEGKARELIGLLERTNRTNAFLIKCKAARPNANWEELITGTEIIEESNQFPATIQIDSSNDNQIPNHEEESNNGHIWKLLGISVPIIVALIALTGTLIDTFYNPSEKPTITASPQNESFDFIVFVQSNEPGDYISDAEVILELLNKDEGSLYKKTDSNGYSKLTIGNEWGNQPAKLIIRAQGYNEIKRNIILNNENSPFSISLEPDNLISSNLETPSRTLTKPITTPTSPPTNGQNQENPTSTPTISPTLAVATVSTSTSTPLPIEKAYTIAISEVMANPCGVAISSDVNDAHWNEYIELYNYGDSSIDVGEWWISDGEDTPGNPDTIVSWASRNPNINLGSTVELNSTIIPPQNYAVILSPAYHQGEGAYKMPYRFPESTILLTIAEGTHLGSDNYGLETSQKLNSVVLYEGNEFIIENLISSYGTPLLTSSPQNLRNGSNDGIPYFLEDCHSAERISPSGEDSEDNWHKINGGNPGDGNYSQ